MAGMLALTGAAFAADDASSGAPPAAGAGLARAKPSSLHRGAANPLERRIALLARELDLDAAQKLKVRALLEVQREQVVRVWQDESLAGALRVARTQAISDKTEDGIRALLTEAQRQKYLKPRTDRATMRGSSDELANYVDKMNRR